MLQFKHSTGSDNQPFSGADHRAHIATCTIKASIQQARESRKNQQWMIDCNIGPNSASSRDWLDLVHLFSLVLLNKCVGLGHRDKTTSCDLVAQVLLRCLPHKKSAPQSRRLQTSTLDSASHIAACMCSMCCSTICPHMLISSQVIMQPECPDYTVRDGAPAAMAEQHLCRHKCVEAETCEFPHAYLPWCPLASARIHRTSIP